MPAMITAMRVAMAVNAVLIAALLFVWGRNYRQLRSKHTLGLLLFGLFLFGENVMGLYFFAVDPLLSAWVADPQFVSPPAQFAMLSLRALESAGLLFLVWITWD